MRQNAAIRVKTNYGETTVRVKLKVEVSFEMWARVERCLVLGDVHYLVISCSDKTPLSMIQNTVDTFTSKLKYLPSRGTTYGRQKVKTRYDLSAGRS